MRPEDITDYTDQEMLPLLEKVGKIYTSFQCGMAEENINNQEAQEMIEKQASLYGLRSFSLS